MAVQLFMSAGGEEGSLVGRCTKPHVQLSDRATSPPLQHARRPATRTALTHESIAAHDFVKK